MTMKKIIVIVLAVVLVGVAGVATMLLIVTSQLPQIISVNDYQPLMVSEVYSQKGEKVGEFFRERRIVVPYEKIPKKLVEAFIAAEDSEFFQHDGINLKAIARAMIANIKAGRIVQGASTITQQVAKTFFLSSEKTYTRKIKDILLARKLETHLEKEQILYLYLNQIYLGHSAYGVAMAAETYFRKKLEELTIPEMAILAGLPQAPSRYSPISNPQSAKERQRYVLTRMGEEGFITAEEAKNYIDEPVNVYMRENYADHAPFYLETVRQQLVQILGEPAVLDQGIKIYTSLDLEKQVAAQKSVQDGLRELDKRQGFRGALKNMTEAEEIAKFLLVTRDRF